MKSVEVVTERHMGREVEGKAKWRGERGEGGPLTFPLFIRLSLAVGGGSDILEWKTTIIDS